LREPCFVYILANPWSRVLYVGMTCDFVRRIATHKAGEVDGFAKKYRVTDLVYFEELDGPFAAIEREKQIKKFRREKRWR
jgi:putative endonuclease